MPISDGFRRPLLGETSPINDHITDTVGKLLKIKAVCDETGLSRATIYRLMKDRNQPFPQPIKIGHASRWSSAEIIAWKKSVLASRNDDN